MQKEDSISRDNKPFIFMEKSNKGSEVPRISGGSFVGWDMVFVHLLLYSFIWFTLSSTLCRFVWGVGVMRFMNITQVYYKKICFLSILNLDFWIDSGRNFGRTTIRPVRTKYGLGKSSSFKRFRVYGFVENTQI